jgi:hypothetical protein
MAAMAIIEADLVGDDEAGFAIVVERATAGEAAA